MSWPQLVATLDATLAAFVTWLEGIPIVQSVRYFLGSGLIFQVFGQIFLEK